MCARYALTHPPAAVCEHFGLAGAEPFPPRYNIAPTQPVAIVRRSPRGGRELALVRWGLIPAWVKDPRAFATLVNARAESVAGKPSFRGALRHRRCLVPASGYYEWTGSAGRKVPHLVRSGGGTLLGLAGLWEHWVGAAGSELETMAILTVPAAPVLAHVHERMPLVIGPADYERWLDCRPGSANVVDDLLVPGAMADLSAVVVNRAVNNVRSEGPSLWDPPAAERL